MKHIKMIKVHW